jgi:prepilin peptidase CpaA
LAFYGLMHGADGLAFAAAGFGVGFGTLFLLWLMGGGGGGDVKLMGALGAMLGAKLTLVVFILSALLALVGIVACGLWDLVAGKRKLARAGKSDGRRLIPYALPVAIGVWMVLAWQISLDRPHRPLRHAPPAASAIDVD